MDDIRAGRLTRILEDLCPPLPGHFLYHPGRRQTPSAVAALIPALCFRGSKDSHSHQPFPLRELAMRSGFEA
jgi:hypothetical protein